MPKVQFNERMIVPILVSILFQFDLSGKEGDSAYAAELSRKTRAMRQRFEGIESPLVPLRFKL